MSCCCTTGRVHMALLPNTFQRHTFLTSWGRTTKSQLWPIRHRGGEALPDPYYNVIGDRKDKRNRCQVRERETGYHTIFKY